MNPHSELFAGEKSFPILPSCEHFAGNEKTMRKALALQIEKGPIFDITLDCEDGAPTGKENEHVRLVVNLLNSHHNAFKRVGVRIHDFTHSAWRQEVEWIIKGAGDIVAYLTIPKSTQNAHLSEMSEVIQEMVLKTGIHRTMPLHVLIETHGALREIDRIALIPGLEVMDFGIMDFVSGHHGAISMENVKSPGQFEHELLRRAKTLIVATALANGIVPSHNVTLDLKNAAQTASDARIARHHFGFMRMWSIHPIQIDAIIEAMTPDHSKMTQAINILLAAQDAGWGPIQYEGELHDRASYRGFWTLIQQARFSGMSLPLKATQRWFS